MNSFMIQQNTSNFTFTVIFHLLSFFWKYNQLLIRLFWFLWRNGLSWNLWSKRKREEICILISKYLKNLIVYLLWAFVIFIVGSAKKDCFVCIFFPLRVLIHAALFQRNSFIINMKKSIGSIYSFSPYYKNIFDFGNKNKEVSLMLLHIGRMSQLYLGYNQMCPQ